MWLLIPPYKAVIDLLYEKHSVVQTGIRFNLNAEIVTKSIAKLFEIT